MAWAAGISRSGDRSAPSHDAVRVAPGSSDTTRMPWGFISSRRVREKPCSACLAMQYDPPSGYAMIDAVLHTLTIVPDPRAIMPGSNARVMR